MSLFVLLAAAAAVIAVLVFVLGVARVAAEASNLRRGLRRANALVVAGDELARATEEVLDRAAATSRVVSGLRQRRHSRPSSHR